MQMLALMPPVVDSWRAPAQLRCAADLAALELPRRQSSLIILIIIITITTIIIVIIIGGAIAIALARATSSPAAPRAPDWKAEKSGALEHSRRDVSANSKRALAMYPRRQMLPRAG